MKRRTALFLYLILAACCLTFLFLWPLICGPIGYRAGTEDEIKELLATHTEAEEPFFTGLAFSGEQLPYDIETATFYLPLDMDTDKWETGELTSPASDVCLLFREELTAFDKHGEIENGNRFMY